MMTTMLLFLSLCLLIFLYVSFQFAWWRPTVSYDYPRVLMYHMISRHKPKARFNKLRVDPAEFERQLSWLKSNGWKFVFVSELASDSTSKQVALTFDDGYRDNYLIADPLLKKYEAKATLYLVNDRHDRDWSSSKKGHHSDRELMIEPKLLDEDIQQMLASQRWELGGHTVTHANLLVLDEHECYKEIYEGRTDLEQAFGRKVTSFAYPFGLFNPTHEDLVKRAGYVFALTTEQGISQDLAVDRLKLKRVKVSGRDGLASFRLRMRTGKCRLRD